MVGVIKTEEMVYIKDEKITPSTLEDTCSVYVQGDVKLENSWMQGNILVLWSKLSIIL